jgi:hypothetical protein
LGGRGRQISEVQDSQVYRARCSTARATQRNPLKKKKKKKKGKERKRKEKNNSCCPNIHRIVFFHWSMVNISGTTLFKEKNSLPFSQ